MKYIIPIFLTFGLLLNPVFAVTDGTDEVTISSPTEGAKVSNTFEISWTMKDEEIDDPAYFVDLYNLGCSQNGGNLGRITSSGATKEGSTYKYNWDTSTGAVSNNLKDGSNYCVRVCGILAKGAGVYSLCDKVSFVFSKQSTEGNSSPKITDTKDIFNISPDQDFSHKVDATDEDGDTLTYSITPEIEYFSIDSETGEITGKTSEIGEYKLTVSVEDGNGGVDTKDFLIKVGIDDSTGLINISYPEEAAVLSETDNQIKWEIDEQLDVKSISLSYSTNQQNWTEIAKLENRESSYDWNIAELPAGRYFIKIDVTDIEDKIYTKISPEFQISETQKPTSTQIDNLNPQSGQKINQKSGFTIEASFSTPEGITIDEESVKLTLNERDDLTVCEVSNEGITCELVGELLEGNYKVFLSLNDSSGSTQTKEWNFEVVLSDGNSASSISGNTAKTVITIFLIGFILILIPWLIYILLRKRKQKKQNPISPITGGVPVGIVEPGIIDSSNTTVELPQNQQITNIPSTPQVQVNSDVHTASQDVNNTEPIVYSGPPLTNISSTYVEPEVVLNPSANMSSPIKESEVVQTTPPSMYAGDEIPEWMQTTSNMDVTKESSSTAEEIIRNTDIAQGSKVYDPYGLALNPDEVSEQQ